MNLKSLLSTLHSNEEDRNDPLLSDGFLFLYPVEAEGYERDAQASIGPKYFSSPWMKVNKERLSTPTYWSSIKRNNAIDQDEYYTPYKTKTM